MKMELLPEEIADQRGIHEALLAAYPRELSLYEVMAATGVGGWSAGQALGRLVREGRASVRALGGCTLYMGLGLTRP
jgi:hypothetical protein